MGMGTARKHGVPLDQHLIKHSIGHANAAPAACSKSVIFRQRSSAEGECQKCMFGQCMTAHDCQG